MNNRFLSETIAKSESKIRAKMLLELENKKDLLLNSSHFTHEYRLEKLEEINIQIKELNNTINKNERV